MAHRGDDAEAAPRRAEAMALRARGLTYRQIAARMGVCHQTAHEYVRQALELARAELKAQAETYIALELERLELPVARLWHIIRDPQVCPADKCQAIDTWRKLSESRRKLLGLDAAKQIDLRAAVLDWDTLAGTVPDVVPDAVEERLRRMVGDPTATDPEGE